MTWVNLQLRVALMCPNAHQHVAPAHVSVATLVPIHVLCVGRVTLHAPPCPPVHPSTSRICPTRQTGTPVSRTHGPVFQLAVPGGQQHQEQITQHTKHIQMATHSIHKGSTCEIDIIRQIRVRRNCKYHLFHLLMLKQNF